MLLPNLSGLAPVRPTGMQAAQDAVLTDPDLLALILSAMNEGRPEEACEIAMQWCATHKVPACEDDTFWFQLMKLVFPHPAYNRPPPEILPPKDAQGRVVSRRPMTYKQWFYALCWKLKYALEEVERKRGLVEQFNNIRRKLANGEELNGLEAALRGQWKFTEGRDEQRASDALAQAELKLKVARWGRLRGDVGYWFVKGAKKLRPEMRCPEGSRRKEARLLTEDEMRKELDRLERIDAVIRRLQNRPNGGNSVMERRDDADYGQAGILDGEEDEDEDENEDEDEGEVDTD